MSIQNNFKHATIFLLILGIICVLVVILIGISKAQNITIGDFTLSDSLAKEYFLDCYTRPDTILNRQYKEGDVFELRIKHNLGTYHLQENTLEPYETSDGDTIFVITGGFNFYWIVPREPSAFDFMLFMNRKNKEKENKK